MLSRLFKSINQSAPDLSKAVNLAAAAPTLLANPLAASGLGVLILLICGRNVYKNYQQTVEANDQNKLQTVLEEFERDHAHLISAAQKLTIDEKGSIDFSKLTPDEQNNPHVLLFKLLFTQLDDKLIDLLDQNLIGHLRTRIRIDLVRQDINDLKQVLNKEIGELKEIVFLVQEFLNAFHHLYSGSNNHRPPLQVLWTLDSEVRKNARFISLSRWTPLIGREPEMNELRNFLLPETERSSRKFQWWLWIGSGGQGKTRLALELVLEALRKGWHAGFFNRNSSYEDWDRWNPEENTLIIFDYASLQKDSVKRALLALSAKAQSCQFELRVLVLERFYEENSDWVKAITCRDSSTDRVIVENSYRNQGSIQPRELKPLQEDDYLEIMEAYYDRCPERKKDSTTPARQLFKETLSNLPTGDYRPLFAAFAGEAAAVNGLNAIRQWNPTDIVQWVLEREVAHWQLKSVDRKHGNLLVLATLLGGVRKQIIWELAETHEFLPSRDDVDPDKLGALSSYTPHLEKDSYFGLEPDILGELFILERLGNEYQLGPGDGIVEEDTKQLIQIAWEIQPVDIAQLLSRCAADFPTHVQLKSLLTLEPAQKENAILFSFAKALAIAHLLSEEAQPLFKEIVQSLSTKHKAFAHYNRGVRYGETGETEKEIEDYTAVIDMPDAPAEQKAYALFNRGVSYGITDETDKAVEDYTTVINMPDAPTDQKAKALVNRGISYGKTGETEKEIEDYTAVIQMPDAPAEEKAKALVNRGISYGVTSETKKEIEDYTAVINMPEAPTDLKAKALVNRGIRYRETGETEKAIEDYTAVIDMPDAPAEEKARALVNRGVRYSETGETDQAFQDYTAVIDMPDAPTYQKARALVGRGVSYGNIGETKKEIEDYTAVIDMPEAPAELKALARVYRGVSYGNIGETEKAIQDYAAVIGMPEAPAEEKAFALFNRGVRYRETGETVKAIQDFTAVIDMPEAPAEEKAKAHYNRGAVYRMINRLTDAETDFSQALCLILRNLKTDHHLISTAERALLKTMVQQGKSEEEARAAISEIERKALNSDAPC